MFVANFLVHDISYANVRIPPNHIVAYKMKSWYKENAFVLNEGILHHVENSIVPYKTTFWHIESPFVPHKTTFWHTESLIVAYETIFLH